MSYGITSYGIEVPTYDIWLSEYVNTLNSKLKEQGYNTDETRLTESSLAADFLKIFAYQDMKIWDAVAASYNSQTWGGAEDIYLDDLLSKRGVFRLGATEGSGLAIVKTDATAPWTAEVPITLQFSGSGDAMYSPTKITQLNKYVSAVKLPFSSITGSLDISGIVSSSLLAYSNSISTPIANDTNKDLVVGAFREIFDQDLTSIFYDDTNFYIGFNNSNIDDPVGVEHLTEFSLNVSCEKWSVIFVEATTVGFSPTPVGGLTSVNPNTFTSGTDSIIIQGVSNNTEFNSGSAIETDAEYRSRYTLINEGTKRSTASAMVTNITNIGGIKKVAVFDNPSYTSNLGVPPFSFMVVVDGGVDQDIAEIIYDTMPLNTNAYGTTVVDVDRLEGGVESIGFTRPSKVSLDIRLDYKTGQSKPISNSTISNVRTQINEYINALPIGGKLYTQRIISIVYSNLSYTNIDYLQAYISVGGGVDSTDDFTLTPTTYFEVPAITFSLLPN